MSQISAALKSKLIVNERKKKGLPVYNFGLGENPLKQPQYFIDHVKQFASEKYYSSCQGIPIFQDTIKQLFSSNKYTVQDILIGNGLKELLFLVQLAFKGKIFHITPSWASYKEQIRILNKEQDLVEIETTIDNNYKINPTDLENILKKYPNDDKLILFNNPNNPTGITHNTQEIKQIASILNKYNTIVLADEIYLNLTHCEKPESISTFIPHLTIRGTSVSKDLACGGYRFGWITFPKQLNELFQICKSYASSIYSSSCVPIQYATAYMLNNKELFHKTCVDTNIIFKAIINNVCDLIDNSTCKFKFKYVRPNSSWYIFINFDSYKEELHKKNILNSYELQDYLMNQFGIITLAGENFNVSGFNLRFSLVDIDISKLPNENSYNNILEGFKILINFFEGIRLPTSISTSIST
jgi:aspartate/methionine/tyrosine aminotransferase